MKDNLFDNEIKKLLEDLDVPFQGQHWDAMSQRLQETTISNTPDTINNFDKVISDKVSHFEVPFSEGNWVALRQRLLANAYLQKWILHTKVFESMTIAIFAFFFVTTVELTPKKPTIPIYNGPVATIEIQKLVPNITNKSALNTIKKDLSNKFLFAQATLTNTIQNSDVPLIALPQEEIEFLLLASTQETAQFLDATISNLPILYPMTTLDPELLESQQELNLPTILVNNKNQSNLGFTVYGVLNANHIITGRDVKHNLDLPDIWSPGYGGGVAISTKHGKHVINVGVEYQEIKYHPQPVVLVSEGDASVGYTGSGTSTVELSMVKLPVSVGYALIDNDRHQVSLNLGMTSGFGKETFKQSSYILGSHNASNKEELNGIAAKASQSSSYTETPNSAEYVNQTQISNPTFFAFANVDIGYEYKLDKSHSLFAKASYQHQISKKGIGIPNDRVNSIGLQFGSRVYL